MADADRKVRITIETRGDPRGAQQVAKALGEIERQTDKIGVDQWAFYDLDAAIRKTVPSVESLDNAGKKAAATKSKLGSQVQQAGYQIGDFAVQVQGGTSALTAFSQQGAQLLGMLGPKGAVAGALLAVGAAAYKYFSDTAKSEAEARKEAELLATAMEDVKKFAAEASDEAIDFQIQEIKDATTEANKLKDAFDGTVKAQAEYDKAQLANIEKVRMAMVEIARLRGEEIDEIGEIKKQEDAAAAARQQAAQQAIAEQERRVAAAKKAEAAAQKEIADFETLRANRQADLEFFGQQVEMLEKKYKLLEEISKQTETITSVDSGLEVGGFPTAAARDAKKQIAAKASDGELNWLKGQIEDLSKKLEENGEFAQQIKTASDNLGDAQQQVAEVTSEAAVRIKGIQEGLTTADIEGSVTELKRVTDSAVETVRDAAAQAEINTEEQKAAKATIDAALKDGLITAEESRAVSHALGILIGGIKTGNTETLETLKSAKAAMDSYWQELHRLRVEFEGLKRQATTPIK